jgi:hypothetical protein
MFSLDPFIQRPNVFAWCSPGVRYVADQDSRTAEDPCKSLEPTRGFEPRTPSLRESNEGGAQSPPVPPGPGFEPHSETLEDYKEP